MAVKAMVSKIEASPRLLSRFSRCKTAPVHKQQTLAPTPAPVDNVDRPLHDLIRDRRFMNPLADNVDGPLHDVSKDHASISSVAHSHVEEPQRVGNEAEVGGLAPNTRPRNQRRNRGGYAHSNSKKAKGLGKGEADDRRKRTHSKPERSGVCVCVFA